MANRCHPEVFRYRLLKTLTGSGGVPNNVHPPYGTAMPVPRHFNPIMWELSKIESELFDHDLWDRVICPWYETCILKSVYDCIAENLSPNYDMCADIWIQELTEKLICRVAHRWFTGTAESCELKREGCVKIRLCNDYLHNTPFFYYPYAAVLELIRVYETVEDTMWPYPETSSVRYVLRNRVVLCACNYH